MIAYQHDHCAPPRRALPRRAAIAVAAVTALIAALAVAPAARAEPTPPDPTVSVTLPGYVANDGGNPARLALTIDNSGDDHQTRHDVHGSLEIQVSDDRFDCDTGVTLAPVSRTNLSIDLSSVISPPGSGASTCNYLVDIDSGDDFTGDPDKTLTTDGRYTATYDLTIDGTTVFPRVTGTLRAHFYLESSDSAYTIAGRTVTANLITLHAPTLSTATLPYPPPGTHYSHTAVSDPGGPVTNSAISDYRTTTARGYYLIGVPRINSGSHRGEFDYAKAVYLDGGSDNFDASHHALALPDTTANMSQTFAFYPRTGTIALTPGVAASNVGFDSGRDYTWVLVARNGQGGASSGDAISGMTSSNGVGTPPTLRAHDVASAPFSLQVHFTDSAPGDTFGTEIYTLARHGIIQGYPDGYFRPGRNVTRQAFAAYVARTYNAKFGGAVPTGHCTAAGPFPDVPADNAFCEEITWLAGHHITDGYPDGAFHPEAPISRQAIAAFFYRLDQLIKHGAVPADDPSCDAKPFADVSTTSDFCGDIGWLAHTSPTITRGRSDGLFHPVDRVTRQVAAAFFYRFVRSENVAW